MIQKHRFGDAVKLIFCFLTFVSPCMRAQSPSARETLRQYVADLKRDPDSQSLREKIIKVVQELKPVPEIPEDARRCFVEGTTIAKTATDKSQQALAVTSFKDALKIAPWWGDAYFNLAVAEELTGQLDEAEASLKLYILTNPGDKEVREAQDHIYALGAKKKLAAADRATQEKRAEAERVVQEKQAEERSNARFSGEWANRFHRMNIRADSSTCQVISSGYGTGTQRQGELRRVDWCKIADGRLQVHFSFNETGKFVGSARFVCEFTLSSDANSLDFGRYVDYPDGIYKQLNTVLDPAQAATGICNGSSLFQRMK